MEGEPPYKIPKMEAQAENKFTDAFSSSFFVDRTKFIQTFFDLSEAEVHRSLFITAPYNFGKTTNLHMLQTFFSNKDDFEAQNTLYSMKYGKDLEIMECEKMMSHIGRFLVLKFDFCGITLKGYSSASCVENIIICTAAKAAQEHRSVLESSSENWIKYLLQYNVKKSFMPSKFSEFITSLDNTEKFDFCKNVGSVLVKELLKCNTDETKEKCIILIDEFDLLAEQLLHQMPKVKTTDVEKFLVQCIEPFDHFIANTIEASGVKRSFLTGRTSYALTTSSLAKSIHYVNFLENKNVALAFGLSDKQVEDLLKRRLIRNVCEEVESSKERQDSVFDSMVKKENPETLEAWTAVVENNQLESIIQEEKEELDDWFKKFKKQFNGFNILVGRKSRGSVFSFSSVLRCVENRKICNDWAAGINFPAFSKGLSFPDFGMDVMLSYHGKTKIMFDPLHRLRVRHLAELKTALMEVENGKKLRNLGKTPFERYKQYLQELGYFTTDVDENKTLTIRVPNEEIYSAIEGAIGFNELFDEDARGEFIESLKKLILSKDVVKENEAHEFLCALSKACSKPFSKTCEITSLDENKLQACLYQIIEHCFESKSHCVEFHIPLHVQQGSDKCLKGMTEDSTRCKCDPRQDKRIDEVLQIGETLFLFEYKYNQGNAGAAFSSIKDRSYFNVLKANDKFKNNKLIAIGINYQKESGKSGTFSVGFAIDKFEKEDYEKVTIYECK